MSSTKVPLAATLREISLRTGLSMATLMNRYYNLGLRGEALEAPVGTYRKGKGAANFHVADNGISGHHSFWPPCSKPRDDQLINRLLMRWGINTVESHSEALSCIDGQ